MKPASKKRTAETANEGQQEGEQPFVDDNTADKKFICVQFVLTDGAVTSHCLMEVDRFFRLVNHELLSAFKQRLKHAAFNFPVKLTMDFQSLVLSIPNCKQGGILFTGLSKPGGLTLKHFLLLEAIFMKKQPFIKHVVEYNWATVPESFTITDDSEFEKLENKLKLRKLIDESDRFVHQMIYWAVSSECEPMQQFLRYVNTVKGSLEHPLPKTNTEDTLGQYHWRVAFSQEQCRAHERDGFTLSNNVTEDTEIFYYRKEKDPVVAYQF